MYFYKSSREPLEVIDSEPFLFSNKYIPDMLTNLRDARLRMLISCQCFDSLVLELRMSSDMHLLIYLNGKSSDHSHGLR